MCALQKRSVAVRNMSSDTNKGMRAFSVVGRSAFFYRKHSQSCINILVMRALETDVFTPRGYILVIPIYSVQHNVIFRASTVQ